MAGFMVLAMAAVACRIQSAMLIGSSGRGGCCGSCVNGSGTAEAAVVVRRVKTSKLI